ncbi:MAG: metalloregulator ArsR/SmtB family transcription factor [Chloroflexota bacterium]|nr:metalloregulator ArsR/SmtB family transcription factor [Chloroflexota bacterium]
MLGREVVEQQPSTSINHLATILAMTVDAVSCCAPLAKAPLSESDAQALSDQLKAVADPARLRLLSMLMGAPGGEACTCDLVEPLGLSQPTVTHHLRRLADAGIVVGDRRGRWTYYRVERAALEALRAVLDMDAR